jgi:hypothetical protein
MPCLSHGYDDESSSSNARVSRLEDDVERLEAALCAALTFIERHPGLTKFYSETDWKEAGITKEKVASWWVAHKKKDQARRAREVKARQELIQRKARLIQRKARFKELSKKVWGELTSAERRFLNDYAHLKGNES